MKLKKSSIGLRATLARLFGAFVLLMAAFGANADDICPSLYQKSGAIQGDPQCFSIAASNTPIGMGSFYCTAEPDRIRAWCGGAPEPEKSCAVADPVYPGSGVVTLREADFVSGDDIPLSFTRTYRSTPLAKNVSAMGPVWFHNWQRQLDLTNANGGSPSKILAYRGNGEPVTFNWSTGNWRSSGFSGLSLAQSSSGWTLTDLQTETVESYSAQGLLLSESTKTGFVRTLTYEGSGLLTSITQHAAGTDAKQDITLRLDYDDKRRLSRLNDPMSGQTAYGYDAHGNLASVTWPDGYVHRYVYDDTRFTNGLTGEVDETGTRIATWTYDAQGRAVAVTHPDAARNVQFAYNGDSTVITDSRRSTTLNLSSVGGMLRPTNSSSSAGTTRSSWDTSGNLLKDVDASGGTSEFSYDEAGRPVRATVKNASGTSIITLRYADVTSLRPAMIASPGSIQSFVYDSHGNAIGISETPTLDTTGASGFDAAKAGGTTVAYGMTYDATNRLSFVQQQTAGKVTAQWVVTRDATGNVFSIYSRAENVASEMVVRDAAHRALYGYNPTGDFLMRYDQRARIDVFKFNEYASPANGGVRRVLKVRFNYSPDNQVISRTGTVARNGSLLDLNDGTDVPISSDEIDQWIDNYNYGDSPIGPPANLQGSRSLLLAGPGVSASTVCMGCHFEAGLIDGVARGILFAWRLAKIPVVRYGIGQGAKKAAEKLDRLKEMCKPAAETEVDGIPPGRVTSEYTDITVGRSVRNIRTDVGKAEFEGNLTQNGWTQSSSARGDADIFTKGDFKFSIRENSNEGSITADFFPGTRNATVKIRLGGK